MGGFSRRKFLRGTAVVGALGPGLAALGASGRTGAPASAFVGSDREDGEDGGLARIKPLVLSTWPFGKEANEKALSVLLKSGGSTLDAVEAGIRVTEAASADGSVGLGGTPNAAGVPQLDACIMHGPGHQAGSVAGLEGIVHPISVARKVVEQSRHVMLVGEGARWFALDHGVEAVSVAEDERKKGQWLGRPSAERLAAAQRPRDGHDTIALLVLGADGVISGGCSTSGLGGKLPGRVGDSPILGAGLYVDGDVGAAGATGIGENVLRYCASFLIVEFLRLGLHPTDACRAVLHRIAEKDPRGYDLHVSLIALDKRGRYGAATTGGFAYAVTTPEFSRVRPCSAIERRPR